MTPSQPLFQQSGLLPIQDRVRFRTVCTVYKALNGLTPEYMSNMFNIKSGRVSRSTTRRDLCVPPERLCTTRKALPYNGAIEWNLLSQSIRESVSFNQFKTSAYKHFLSTM